MMQRAHGADFNRLCRLPQLRGRKGKTIAVRPDTGTIGWDRNCFSDGARKRFCNSQIGKAPISNLRLLGANCNSGSMTGFRRSTNFLLGLGKMVRKGDWSVPAESSSGVGFPIKSSAHRQTTGKSTGGKRLEKTTTQDKEYEGTDSRSAVDYWCERGDSNPHGFTRQILSLVRLPIPPLSRCREYSLLCLIAVGKDALVLVREFGDLHVIRLQQFAGGMIEVRHRELIVHFGLQQA
jgi:hypothetical protein